MGRPRVAEIDDVVLAAMALFRERGYDATSIRDLEAATGLKAASLYKAFGSKAGLFDASLARYHRDVVERRTAEHLRPELGLAGIRSFFTSTYLTEPQPAHGCLVTNSAVEYASIDPAAQRRVREGLEGIRNALAHQLRAAKDTGEVRDIDVGSTADALLVLYEGMLVLARTGRATRINLDRTIDGVLRLITPTGEP